MTLVHGRKYNSIISIEATDVHGICAWLCIAFKSAVKPKQNKILYAIHHSHNHPHSMFVLHTVCINQFFLCLFVWKWLTCFIFLLHFLASIFLNGNCSNISIVFVFSALFFYLFVCNILFIWLNVNYSDALCFMRLCVCSCTHDFSFA